MALFTKEPDKSAKVQPPPSQAPSPGPAHPSSVQTTPLSATRSNGPAASEGRAYLDKGTRISGKLAFDGPARIDGEVDGEINAKDDVAIGETAVVSAQIKAASVIVAGKVNGDITAAKRIEIRPSAKVQGNLATPVLVVHEGALFEGHCSMQVEGARDERKLAVVPKEERLAQAAGQKPV